MFSFFECLFAVLLAMGAGGCLMRRVRGQSRVLKAAGAVAIGCFLLFAAIKQPPGSPPHQQPPLPNPPTHTLNPGGGLLSSPLFDLPEWFEALKLPSFGWDGIANIPLIWRKRTFADSPEADILLDRDNDHFDDFLEFIHGTDPRAFSTAGGAIPDGWLVNVAGLDPLVLWDDVKSPNGMTYREIYFLMGDHYDPQDPTDYGAWLARGLEPGVDAWPQEDDMAGDVMWVSVRVLGPARSSALVSIGPIRHVGSRAGIYALRTGRRYDVSVRDVRGTGLAGEVEIKPVAGMATYAAGFRQHFVLGAGGTSQPSQSQGGGMTLMSSQQDDELLGGLDTWLLLVPNHGCACIHGRLNVNVWIVKGGSGTFPAEPGTYAWKWSDGKPWGSVKNVSPGVGQVRLTHAMAEKWQAQYGHLPDTSRELGCSFTPEGATTRVEGLTRLDFCIASALPDTALVDEDGNIYSCLCGSGEYYDSNGDLWRYGCDCGLFSENNCCTEQQNWPWGMTCENCWTYQVPEEEIPHVLIRCRGQDTQHPQRTREPVETGL